MNQKEKSYILKRIDEITTNKRNEITQACLIKGISFNNQEKIERLKKGDFSINPSTQYGSWYNWISFGEKATAIDVEKSQKLIKQVLEDATQLKDKIMLGNDNGEILKLLSEFSNKIYL